MTNSTAKASRVKSSMSKRVRVFTGKQVPKAGIVVSGQRRSDLRAEIHHASIPDPSETLKRLDEALSGLHSNKPLDVSDDEWEDLPNSNNLILDVNNILSGNQAVDISHAGGEFIEMMQSLTKERKVSRADYRKRCDRTLARTKAFTAKMPQIVDTFLEWHRTQDPKNRTFTVPGPEASCIQGTLTILVIDVFKQVEMQIPLCQGDNGVAMAIVRQGFIPCSPFTPTLAISTRTLELYRCSSLRCPRMALQAFAKMLCDLHNVPYKSYLTKQLTICFDVYLEILDEVNSRVQSILLRDSPFWRLKHACPACTYKLQEEPSLSFEMLFTMDGNDSLKRIDRNSRTLGLEYAQDDDVDDLPTGRRQELQDKREVRGDYYLSRGDVEKWRLSKPSGATVDVAERSPCTERWKNMSEQMTSKAWSIFDETGVFAAICRHGFVLCAADMVKSGEGSQYALAVVDRLLQAFGSNLGGGYDVGCRFKTTITRSELGPEAARLNYTSLVGAFHGHAHNRLCQLSNLTTYVDGLGLSDLEGCERLFSKSNELASTVRHANIFHRRQRIYHYFQHLDLTDTYQNLSENLYSTYKNALEILAGSATLRDSMQELGIPDLGVFKTWLDEERQYLAALTKEPEIETNEIEYLQRLINLQALETRLEAAQKAWNIITPNIHHAGFRDRTNSIETERRHTLELRDKTLDIVQDLEARMNIQGRWKPGDANWIRVNDLLIRRRYRRCLDKLEEVIIRRMFELAKMNQVGTGYKMRQHIGKALKVRSQAVKVALDKYNEAARELIPPRPALQWDEVVEHAFLAEFDILSETRHDVRLKPWANPAARRLMDMHFKIERAKEEVDRLNVEIKRFVTYMNNEEYLKHACTTLSQTSPGLAHVVQVRLSRLRLFNQHHRQRLVKLTNLPGFNISALQPGSPLEPNPVLVPDVAMDVLVGESSDGDSIVDTEGGILYDIGTGHSNEADEDNDEEDMAEEQVQEILDDIDMLSRLSD